MKKLQLIISILLISAVTFFAAKNAFWLQHIIDPSSRFDAWTFLVVGAFCMAITVIFIVLCYYHFNKGSTTSSKRGGIFGTVSFSLILLLLLWVNIVVVGIYAHYVLLSIILSIVGILVGGLIILPHYNKLNEPYDIRKVGI